MLPAKCTALKRETHYSETCQDMKILPAVDANSVRSTQSIRTSVLPVRPATDALRGLIKGETKPWRIMPTHDTASEKSLPLKVHFNDLAELIPTPTDKRKEGASQRS